MAERKLEWPKAGELVIATIETVRAFCVFPYREVTIESYDEITNVVKTDGQVTFRRE